MSAPMRSPSARLAAAIGAGALAPAIVLAASSGTAAADTKVHAAYKVSGSTFLKSPNFTLPLGPGKLSSTLDANNGKLTATLSLPDATGSFKQLGLIPVTATARFINDGPTTGKLNLKTGAVRTTSKITLRIVKLTVLGLPIPVGPACQTAAPVAVILRSQPKFNILLGGRLAGSYTIGNFAHCGLATVLINATIPGSGNTITFKLGKAKIG